MSGYQISSLDNKTSVLTGGVNNGVQQQSTSFVLLSVGTPGSASHKSLGMGKGEHKFKRPYFTLPAIVPITLSAGGGTGVFALPLGINSSTNEWVRVTMTGAPVPHQKGFTYESYVYVAYKGNKDGTVSLTVSFASPSSNSGMTTWGWVAYGVVMALLLIMIIIGGIMLHRSKRVSGNRPVPQRLRKDGSSLRGRQPENYDYFTGVI